MRRVLPLAIIAVFAAGVATEVTANKTPPPPPSTSSSPVYNLLIHGRSSEDHCVPVSGVNSATSDKNGYWSDANLSGLSNVRYIGFIGTRNGGAYSWENCGAQRQFHNALQTFCTGGNQCKIYTHSTGGLVAAYYFYNSGASGLNILDVRLMANASGGSELADISSDYLSWLGFTPAYVKNLDESVSTSGARTWNHNDTAGLTLDLTSGESSDYLGVTSPFLPGHDDGVLANHTLCGVNKVADVDRSCPNGSGSFTESYGCGFLWLSTCSKTHHRWSGYNTVLMRSGDTHGDAKEHY